MIKKILPVSIFVLLVIVIVLLGLQNLLNKNKTQNNSNLEPTAIEGRQGSGVSGGSTQNSNGASNTYTTTASPNVTGTTAAVSEETFKKKLPLTTSDFTIGYSNKLGTYVVSLKTNLGQQAYNDWLSENPSLAVFLPTESTLIAHQSIAELEQVVDTAQKNEMTPAQYAEEDTKKFVLILNNILSLPDMIQKIGNTITPAPTTTPTNAPQTKNSNSESSTTASSGSSTYTYYSQCGSPYGDYQLPVPDGNGKYCTECSAGCGPTSLAMILASYVNSSATPPTVIDDLHANGIYVGCGGTYMDDLKSYMSKQKGVKVSDYIVPSGSGVQANQVADDFRGYIQSGWTIFVLANFKENGGGHYFWVTDVSTDGNILAYDPYYGRGKALPFNENQYTPAPYYRYAFAVKKI